MGSPSGATTPDESGAGWQRPAPFSWSFADPRREDRHTARNGGPRPNPYQPPLRACAVEFGGRNSGLRARFSVRSPNPGGRAGATPAAAYKPPRPRERPGRFQSTPPRGGDSGRRRASNRVGQFQSTPPRGGDRRKTRTSSPPSLFQSTPPRGGDNAAANLPASVKGFQSTPPRGGDTILDKPCARIEAFQSTPPRGGDSARIARQRPDRGFNPRPREGATPSNPTARPRRGIWPGFANQFRQPRTPDGRSHTTRKPPTKSTRANLPAISRPLQVRAHVTPPAEPSQTRSGRPPRFISRRVL